MPLFEMPTLLLFFDEQQRSTALIQAANNFATGILINEGNFNFTWSELPQEAQLESSIYHSISRY